MIINYMVNSLTAMGSGGNGNRGGMYFLGRYVPMAGIQFGRIVSFSLTLHTWELIVTSEVGRKMILLGHPINYVIFYYYKVTFKDYF